ncbi:MAG: hypothetical protein NZO58_09280, partial [Gemmataceae bacterium]|nr:hypothetical protein [Gemmataceae bacterium]
TGTTTDTIPLCNFFQYHCNHSEDVMTAWAIGPDDKAAVLTQFLFEQEKKQNDLHHYLADLQRCVALVQAFRQPKRDDARLAVEWRNFRSQKDRFEKEQAVLAFAAATAKDALDGTTQQADQQVGMLLHFKPNTDKKNHDPRLAAPQLDPKTMENVLNSRKASRQRKDALPDPPAQPKP